ncbi:MAG: hypothetical protein WDN27_05175 [Candidatus Saccharibacteria bacterium]
MPFNYRPKFLRTTGESTEGLGHENQMPDIPDEAKPNRDRGAVGEAQLDWNARMLVEGGPDVFMDLDKYRQTRARLAAEDAAAEAQSAQEAAHTTADFGPVTIVRSIHTHREE